MSKTCNKIHAARAVRLFYSFNQSYRSDLALPLLSSILKLPSSVVILGIDVPVVHSYGDVRKISVTEDKESQE